MNFIVNFGFLFELRAWCSTGQGALCKIDLLIATPTNMLFVKFVRKDLDFLSTVGAFTDERLQIFKLLKTRAMKWRGHKFLPSGQYF